MRFAEFYSGIGGLHYAAEQAWPGAELVQAFDINDTANDVYEHNFGHRPCQHHTPSWQSNISSLSAVALDKLAADAWLLSPPCQPYTRRGKQRHSADERAGSFLSLLDQVREMTRPPTLVLVENVVGFDRSDSRDVLVESLNALGYSWLETVASPADLGIPYSRPRYFLLASRKGPVLASGTRWTLPFKLLAVDGKRLEENGAAAQQGSSTSGEDVVPGTTSAKDVVPGTTSATSLDTTPTTQGRPLSDYLLSDPEAELRGGVLLKLPNNIRFKRHRDEAAGSGAPPLADSSGGADGASEPDGAGQAVHDHSAPALAPKTGGELGPLGLTPAVLLKHGWCLDIVTGASTRSCCFTKTYGQYIKGSGSVIAEASEAAVAALLHDFPCLAPGAFSAWGPTGSAEDLATALSALSLRFFSPREVANLHSFPSAFAFPTHTTLRQRYSLLGNSLHVGVVAELLKLLLPTAQAE